jgi:hypothetical protein
MLHVLSYWILKNTALDWVNAKVAMDRKEGKVLKDSVPFFRRVVFLVFHVGAVSLWSENSALSKYRILRISTEGNSEAR